jgi:hypothetical protein
VCEDGTWGQPETGWLTGTLQDASTGVQPFLPPRPPATTDVARRAVYVLKYGVVGPLVAVVRLALAAIVLLWLVTVATVGDRVRASRPRAHMPLRV